MKATPDRQQRPGGRRHILRPAQAQETGFEFPFWHWAVADEHAAFEAEDLVGGGAQTWRGKQQSLRLDAGAALCYLARPRAVLTHPVTEVLLPDSGLPDDCGRKPDAEDPTWFKDAIIYQLHLKSFFDATTTGSAISGACWRSWTTSPSSA